MSQNNRNDDNNRGARLLPGQPESARTLQAVFLPPHYPLPGPAAREPHLRDYLIILVVIVTRPASLNTPSEASSAKNQNGSPTGPQTITIGLKQLLASGDPQYNIPIFGGDVISVPRAGIVYVVGAVQRSGGFALKSDSEEMTALKAVALAQGLKGTAKPARAVITSPPKMGMLY